MTTNIESPFSPGRPVVATEFQGRKDLVDELVGVARSSCKGNFRIAYISGERGIGKSSLAQMVRYIAERDLQMATAYVPLGGINDLKGLVRRCFERIVQDNASHSWIQKITKKLGNRIKKVGLFGVEIELKIPKDDLQGLVNNFAGELDSLFKTISDDRKGLMLVLDDINGLAENPDFSNWLKSMVDGVATRMDKNKPPVFILLTGLEERRQQMISHNPSVARIFQPTRSVEP